MDYIWNAVSIYVATILYKLLSIRTEIEYYLRAVLEDSQSVPESSGDEGAEVTHYNGAGFSQNRRYALLWARVSANSDSILSCDPHYRKEGTDL